MTKPDYRPEIDGLRAIAIIPVIFFHSGITLFEGGYVGVDIFFVISGYLITLIILDDLERDVFSLVSFYQRRARRILPALLFMILCCIPFAIAWMLPSELEEFFGSATYATTFLSNLYFAELDNGYFSEISHELPLLHTWSLAVEEQFYITFPIILCLIWRLVERTLLILISIFIVTSFLLAQSTLVSDPDLNFYSPLTRAWELFIGVAGAWIVKYKKPTPNKYLALLALAGLFASFIIFNESTLHVSFIAFLPVFSTLVFIVFADQNSFPAKILAVKPLVAVGLISYSAYLWHVPVFSFSRIRGYETDNLTFLFPLLGLTIILATLSWKYVERPFRDTNFSGYKVRKPILAIFFTAGFIFLFGSYGQWQQGFQSRVSEEILRYDAINSLDFYSQFPCMSQPTSNPTEFSMPEECNLFLNNGKAKVFFLGDSQLSMPARQLQVRPEMEEYGSYSFGTGGCPSLRGFSFPELNDQCANANRYGLALAEKLEATTLVIASRFPAYLYGTGFNNLEGGIESDFQSSLGIDNQTSDASIQDTLNAYIKELEFLLNDYNVILIDPIPETGWNVPRRISKCLYFGRATDCEKYASTSLSVYLERNKLIDTAFSEIDSERLHRINTSEIFCGVEWADRCSVAKDGQSLYLDDDHLSVYGSVLLGRHILEELSEIYD